MMVNLFDNLLLDGTSPIPFNEICRVSEASFAVLESISKSGIIISLVD